MYSKVITPRYISFNVLLFIYFLQVRTSVFIDTAIDNYQSASNGVVLTLKKGQEVKVVVDTTSAGEFVGAEYSVFSGFFLFP